MDPENITLCAKRMCPNLSVDCFLPIICRRASNVIADFDQKTSLQESQAMNNVVNPNRPGLLNVALVRHLFS